MAGRHRVRRLFIAYWLSTGLLCSAIYVVATNATSAAAATPEAPTPLHDSYPWRTAQASGLDSWGFAQRQCVSYAAWRLAQSGVKGFRNHITEWDFWWGSAWHWDEAAQRLGYKVTSVPRVGAIAQWNADEASPSRVGTFRAGRNGHVAVVRSVGSDGWVTVDEYNTDVRLGYSTAVVKAPRYLYIQ